MITRASSRSLVGCLIVCVAIVPRASFAQSPAPASNAPPASSTPPAQATSEVPGEPLAPLTIVGNGTGVDVVTVHRVDRPRAGAALPDFECTLPCTVRVPAGRYDAITVDTDMHERHHAITVGDAGARIDVDVRSRSDRTMLGTGIGLLTFGAIAVSGGLILVLGGLGAQSNANGSAMQQMTYCASQANGDPNVMANCCTSPTQFMTLLALGVPLASIHLSGSTNACVAPSYSTDLIVGGVAIGVGLVGAVAGAVLMVMSQRRSTSPDRAVAVLRRLVPDAIATAPAPGGGVVSAVFRF
jgi:hypothetical protein